MKGRFKATNASGRWSLSWTVTLGGKEYKQWCFLNLKKDRKIIKRIKHDLKAQVRNYINVTLGGI